MRMVSKEQIEIMREELLEGILCWLEDMSANALDGDVKHFKTASVLIQNYLVDIPELVTLSWDSMPKFVEQLLKGFAFSVSSNEDFLYNLSYLYERIDEFWPLVKAMNAHLNAVCKHWIILQSSFPNELKGYKIVYNDFYTMSFNEDMWQYAIKCSNISKLTTFDEKNVIVKMEKNALSTEVFYTGKITKDNDQVENIRRILLL